MELLKFYRKPFLSEAMERNLIRTFEEQFCEGERRIEYMETEMCYYVELNRLPKREELEALRWLLSETFEPYNFGDKSFLSKDGILEVGPRMNFVTPWSTNAVQAITQCGIPCVTRIEHSRKYKPFLTGPGLSGEETEKFLRIVHDRMTEQPYPEPLRTFETGIVPEPMREIPILERGPDALRIFAEEKGLALDEKDIEYILNYFKILKRNPTDTEIFQYGQANSDHSRHHGWKCIAVIDGEERPESLMDMIKKPYILNPGKTLIAFKDNASASGEYEIKVIVPRNPGRPSQLRVVRIWIGITFDAETHCHPSFIAPFPAADTGVGGRLRDDMGPGRGALIGLNTSLYMVGKLLIPGYRLPWEKVVGEVPSNKANPLEILIEASNGASNYANKFGIPLTGGAVRSFDMRVPSEERRAYLKPIMFTGGMGVIDKRHLEKKEPKRGMKIVLLGGPGYRIGVGGGSASSMVAGKNVEELDFNSVQRGDPEMERRVYNVIDTCVKIGNKNPIQSIHDLGAGGVCNAGPEIVYPSGALIYLNKIPLGDETLSKLEIWGNESQERMVVLVYDDGLTVLKSVCEREKCPFAVIGYITGDGKLVVKDERDGSTPVNMDMSFALGDVPRKKIFDETIHIVTRPLKIPSKSKFEEILKRVLSHPDVASKQYLTVKADRSVGGRVVRQQCCGPLHLPLADYSLWAPSFFENVGAATSIGQMPIIGLVNMEAMGRMSLAEAITNIMFANGTSFGDINLCVNAMWALYKKGEMANIHAAYKALTDMQIQLGIRTDGGKDSSSMCAIANDLEGNPEDVKAPGTLVISARMPCPDISNSKNATPDIKRPGESRLMYIDFSDGRRRLGGTMFARVLNQLGDETPDVDNPETLKDGFEAIQEMLKEKLILAGHDISDGGIATTLCEMAIGGNCGFTVDFLLPEHGLYETMFAEELGVVIEYLPENFDKIKSILDYWGLKWHYEDIGITTNFYMTIYHNGRTILKRSKHRVRRWWEMTSFMLDTLQANPECVEEEMQNTKRAENPVYSLSPDFWKSRPVIESLNQKPRVAVIREEGTNAHEEMQAGFIMAGFEVWDVTMTDIIHGRMLLENVQQIVPPGGFSFGDVLDAGKGWAGTILFNKNVREQFEKFYKREKTLSFGVCNGCQVMSLIGWVPWKGISMEKQPRFIRNKSERFECRFPTVKVQESPAVMLKDMAGSVMGIWVRHGEGRFRCDDDLMKHIEREGLAPIRFCEQGTPTERYPFNTNGSPNGITALCSPDGRHLAIMPHPEALLRMEVWPWVPQEWKDMEESPWLRMFHNARAFFG